jgi:hypothetical protein
VRGLGASTVTANAAGFPARELAPARDVVQRAADVRLEKGDPTADEGDPRGIRADAGEDVVVVTVHGDGATRDLSRLAREKPLGLGSRLRLDRRPRVVRVDAEGDHEEHRRDGHADREGQAARPAPRGGRGRHQHRLAVFAGRLHPAEVGVVPAGQPALQHRLRGSGLR